MRMWNVGGIETGVLNRFIKSQKRLSHRTDDTHCGGDKDDIDE